MSLEQYNPEDDIFDELLPKPDDTTENERNEQYESDRAEANLLDMEYEQNKAKAIRGMEIIAGIDKWSRLFCSHMTCDRIMTEYGVSEEHARMIRHAVEFFGGRY